MDEPRAKATVLMVVCKGDGNISATVVRTKTDKYGVEMVLRFLSTYEDVEIKTDGEPSIVEIARRVQSRRDRTTMRAQTSVGGHREIGANPIRGRNRLRMRGQEAVDTSHRLCHLEKWSWRRLPSWTAHGSKRSG